MRAAGGRAFQDEVDAVAPHPGVLHRGGPGGLAAGPRGAVGHPAPHLPNPQLLEALVHLHHRHVVALHPDPPPARHIRRHDPEVDVVHVVRDRHGAVRLPLPHVEVVGDDPRTRPQLTEELGAEPEVEVLEEVERDDRRRAQVGLEEVALDEADPVVDAGPARVPPRDPDQGVLELDADPVGSVSGRRHDRDAAVARAQVVEGVGGRGLDDVQHRLDHPHGRDHEGDVRKAVLVRLLGPELPGAEGRDGEERQKRRDRGTTSAGPSPLRAHIAQGDPLHSTAPATRITRARR